MSYQRRENSLPRSETPQAANLSELDTLLNDLSAANYSRNLAKLGDLSVSPSQSYVNSSQTYLNDSIKRPSVDSLLDELSQAHSTQPIYAMPNG